MGLGEILTDVKAASVVAGTAFGTGLANTLEMIPDDIGKLGSLVGVVLAIVLIRTHLRKGATDHEKTLLEIAALKELAALRSRSREDRNGED